MGILKDEFLSNKTSEKLLNFAKLTNDGSKSTQPVKMEMLSTQRGKMFVHKGNFKTPEAKAK